VSRSSLIDSCKDRSKEEELFFSASRSASSTTGVAERAWRRVKRWSWDVEVWAIGLGALRAKASSSGEAPVK
jgi:hypothetical protein